ncbi:TenA family transcriptional regulator [Mycobacterium sp. 236(2023)]|uniref:TenA family transcriptional regulator n=1 Tax=Mycobacterium sp. 236(2023) TaxID=3038163 RepID=UPI002414E68C|nr:TenA family transcriptional regulator [Mycobacterium sp. 236(2023)]MDG4664085.1 TenA family transcriptional regulator [Mycobacterium sp. 236(2023)]
MLDDLWAEATRHRFLDAVRDGAITDADFNRWLVQDSVFVGDLLTFQARLLARAQRNAQATLASGCVALESELAWFDEQAALRGIDMDQPPLPATLAYRALLTRLDEAPYDTAITALWVVEEVYLRAWTTAASESSPYREFVEHWTDPGFAAYVAALRDLAVPAGRDDIIAEVLSHEIAFWDMALTNT